MERVLPPSRERTVKFSLPPSHLGARLWRDQTGRDGDDLGVVDTFVRAIETTKKEGSASIGCRFCRRAIMMKIIPRVIPAETVVKKRV